MITIGKYQVNSINLGDFALDGGAMFGVVPKNLWAKSYPGADEQNRIPLSTRVMLLQSEDKNILVDTGNGLKMSPKLADIYKIGLGVDQIDLGLQKFGLKKSDITDVLLTHLHFDHCGGATEMVGGVVQPTFPNAKYYVQKEQYDWALNPKLKDKASFLKQDYEPLFQEGVLHFTDGAGEIFEGIEVLPINGHTKSLQMVRVFDKSNNSQINSALFVADLFPTSAHLPIPFVMGYDNFPLTTIEEKQFYLPKAYDNQWLLLFEHDSFHQAGFVGKNEKGFFMEKFINITE